MAKADGGTLAPNANSPGNTPDMSLASSQSASDATVSQPTRTVNGDNMVEASGVQWAGNEIATPPAASRNDSVDETAIEEDNGLQWAGNMPAEGFGDSIEVAEAEDNGLQWAGSETEERTDTPPVDMIDGTVAENNNIETEDVTYGEQQDQSESGSTGRDNAVRTDGNADRSTKRTAREAIVQRSEEARRVQSNVKAHGGSRTSLRKLGLTVGSEKESVQLVTREAYTPALEKAQKLADEAGLM